MNYTQWKDGCRICLQVTEAQFYTRLYTWDCCGWCWCTLTMSHWFQYCISGTRIWNAFIYINKLQVNLGSVCVILLCHVLDFPHATGKYSFFFLTIGASVSIKYSPWLDSQFLYPAKLLFDNENHWQVFFVSALPKPWLAQRCRRHYLLQRMNIRMGFALYSGANVKNGNMLPQRTAYCDLCAAYCSLRPWVFDTALQFYLIIFEHSCLQILYPKGHF